MENSKRIVEIDGVKIEVDLRTAKKVEHFKVGDNVRVLVPSYGKNYKVHPGVIVGFDNFERLPTICVAYLVVEYNSAKIEFAYINSVEKDEKVEIAPAHDMHELHFQKADVLSQMEKMAEAKREEVRDIERKMAYFNTYFGRYFEANAVEV